MNHNQKTRLNEILEETSSEEPIREERILNDMSIVFLE